MSKSVAFSGVRSFSRTGKFIRRQMWIWPLCAAAVLALVGIWLRGSVEASMKAEIADQLTTILNADVTALKIWFRAQEQNVAALAADDDVSRLIERLIELAARAETDRTVLITSPEQKELRGELKPVLEAQGYVGFAVISRAGVVLASPHDEIISNKKVTIPPALLSKVFAGKATVVAPYKSLVVLETAEGVAHAGVPTMFAVAPVRNAKSEIIAGFGLRIRPEVEFTEILSVARSGQTGETYAFNKDGLMLSQSRFDDQLKRLGLLTDDDQSQSILTLQLRDPQVNMVEGGRPSLSRREQPLTQLVKDTIDGKPGVNTAGYRDYRGVPCIGASIWLPDYEMGVITETDITEAFQPLFILRTVFWGLFSLLALAALLIFAGTLLMARFERKMRLAVIEARQLGQYTLEEKLGAGGMGIVYKARHALLRRPTAVKLLGVDKTTDQAIERFEREVQLTSQLNHPNTIAIYDYGRTPEGVFYYAMEYLDGVPLDLFVERFGPQPAGRVIHILQQICGSLAEAHGIGLIHRDIKPANIIINQRGGAHDVIKVLDFGLVKAVDERKQTNLTAAGSITGTPQYLSPEGVERPDSVDARSDLYAVGAVGYFLLTATPVFEGESIMAVCMKQVREMPQRPSERLGREVDADLERVILQCLAKNKGERPQTAQELAESLARCPAAGSWSKVDARQWWDKHFNAATRQTPSATSETKEIERTAMYSQ